MPQRHQHQQLHGKSNLLSPTYIAGLICVLGVVVLWLSSAYLMERLFKAEHFNKPFFVTYFNTAALSLYLIPITGRNIRSSYCHKRSPLSPSCPPSPPSPRPSPEARTLLLPYTSQVPSPDASQLTIPIFDEPQSPSDDHPTEPPFKETAWLALEFCFLWFVSNVTYNYSLSQTTVPKATILSTTSGFFTLIFGAMAKTEIFNKLKLLAIIVCVGGVCFVSLAPHTTMDNTNGHGRIGNNETLGDSLALMSALLYGLYITLLKKRMNDGEGVSLSLFFGLVGIFNIFLMWPGFVVIHYAGIEEWGFPAKKEHWMMVIGNALLGTVVSDYLWAQATLWTSALVVTLGISLTIPASMVIQGIKESQAPHWMSVFGAALVLLGFFGINRITVQEPSASDDLTSTIYTDENTSLLLPSANSTRNDRSRTCPDSGSI